MDYRAIAEFLQWYLDEIERRYQEFNRSGLTEEDWQQSLRQQQRITSVVSEEMTNWADRLPGDIGSKFFKSAMSDSRKVLMPPLFVAHDRTLTALGMPKGLPGYGMRRCWNWSSSHDPPHDAQASFQWSRQIEAARSCRVVAVTLPQIERKITDFTHWSSPPSQPLQPTTPHHHKHHRLIFGLR
jgi:hypothetical protein